MVIVVKSILNHYALKNPTAVNHDAYDTINCSTI